MPTSATERQDTATHDEVLTLGEAATYLKLAERTVHRMISRREIPCAKVGGQWRFMRSVLDDWLVSRMQVVPRNEVEPLLQGGGGHVSLSAMVDERWVVDPVQPGSPAEVLAQLVRPLADAGVVRNPGSLVEQLLAREQLAPTALGHGVAVPHVRRPEDNAPGGPPVVVGICRNGTEFDAPDGLPVSAFFLLSTSSELVHLRLLKRITVMFRDDSLMPELLAHHDAGRLLIALRRAEHERFPGG